MAEERPCRQPNFAMAAMILRPLFSKKLEDSKIYSPGSFEAANTTDKVGRNIVMADRTLRWEDDQGNIDSTCR